MQTFNDFVLPYNYGKITDFNFAKTNRVVINIQDLHCHLQVQKNISNIIGFFDKKYSIKNIYLECAYGDIDTSWIKDSAEKLNYKNTNELLDKMLSTGRLTGAEYYSAKYGKNTIIKGLEKKEPYIDNLKRFGNIIEEQEKIEKILEYIDNSLLKLKQKYYTKRQYKLEKLSKQYQEKTISQKKYYALLEKHAEQLGVDLTDYNNTSMYIMLLNSQNSLKTKKINQELQYLALLLKNKLPYNVYKSLLNNTNNFLQIDKLCFYIKELSKQYNLDVVHNFSNLDKYFRYIELSQKINPVELLKEENKLVNEINLRFSQTKSQREIVFLIDFTKYLKDYVTNKITTDDYKYYVNNIEEYKRLWNKYVDNRVFSLLEKYLVEIDKFYKVNNDRNVYFSNNLFKDRESITKIENVKEGNNELDKIINNINRNTIVDVVITGGYHTQTNKTAQQYLEDIMIVVNGNIAKILEENEYQIMQLEEQDIAQAISDFKNMNILLQDRFAKTEIEVQVDISINSIKSILTAA